MKAMQTFTGPYTRRLLGELTSYGSSEGGLTGPERKIGFVRKASRVIPQKCSLPIPPPKRTLASLAKGDDSARSECSRRLNAVTRRSTGVLVSDSQLKLLMQLVRRMK